MREYDEYFSGRRLYGDNFGPEEIRSWYVDEKEGYANLGAKDFSNYSYAYHALNRLHAYRYLGDREFTNVMGFGSAYGDEFLPIKNKIRSLTIVDPSEAFERNYIHEVPSVYVKPCSDGRIPLEDHLFDLIVCLGVLHHIPNVSFVMGELSRTLADGGMMIVREPIISMGDWRKPRYGLTKRERGIPINILLEIIKSSGLIVKRKSYSNFPAVPRLFPKYFGAPYNNNISTIFDMVLSKAFSWNINYHPKKLMDYFRPTSVFLILTKDDNK